VGEAEAARLSGAGKAKKSELVDICDGLISGKTPAQSSAKDRIDAWAPAPMRFEPPPPADEDDVDGASDDDGADDDDLTDGAVIDDADDEDRAAA
jgi:hypothetical protein